MVLDHIPDDAELVEVAAAALCPERLLFKPKNKFHRGLEVFTATARNGWIPTSTPLQRI